MRLFALTLCAAFFAAPVALADGHLPPAAILPMDGVMGDTLGCMREADFNANITDRPLERRGITISGSAITGLEWHCTYGAIWPYSDGRNAFAIQGLCSGGDIPYLEQFIADFAPPPIESATLYQADGTIIAELSVCDLGDGERG
ncbi:MAG: hypothetical protein AAGH60_12930 [Pseudomonadota bacterium]